MESLTDKGVQMNARFKGNDLTGTYKYGEKYLLKVIKDPSENVLVELATGKGKRSYTLAEYKKDWEELGTPEVSKLLYSLTITYNEDGTPKLDHTNSGMREMDIIASLEIAKLQMIQAVVNSGKGKK